jgi:hypothetical protein
VVFFNRVDGEGGEFLICWPVLTTIKADPRDSGFTAFSANRSGNSRHVLSRHKEVEEFVYSSLKGSQNSVEIHSHP